MDKEQLELWKKAGNIAGSALIYGKSLLKENANVYDIALKIDDFIENKGAKQGFPVQLSINNIAAHYTPYPNDTLLLKSGDIVKLDLGTQVDGYIGDTALTVEIKTNDHKELINASKSALQAAIKLAKPGTKVYEIGEAVSNVIEGYGLSPIHNLSGHMIERYELHSGLSIPNYNNSDKTELTEGMVLAIEPFATTGIGQVKEGKPSSNYRWPGTNKQPRDLIARKVFDFIKKEIKTLPFAERNLIKAFPGSRLKWALNILEKEKIIYQYPQLPEKSDGLVSQHEHTIYVSDKQIVLTKIDN